jgi:hypothetical protein
MKKLIWFTALQPWIIAMLLVENPSISFMVMGVFMTCFILYNQIFED